MDKINFSTQPTAEQAKEKEKLISELKNNQLLTNELIKRHIDQSYIEKYPYKCNRFLKQMNTCMNCKGLANCKQERKGYYLDLSLNGNLFAESFKMCKYLREASSQVKHLDQYLVNDLPKNLETVSFENLDIDNDTDAYQQVVTEVLSAYKQNSGLYLYGNPGTGKTYLAACVTNQAARDGKKVSFVSIPAFFVRLKSMVTTGEYTKEVNRIMRSDLVVLDDIGAENITSWTRDEILFAILNYRMENNLPTWFTSNEDFTSLEDRYKSTKTNDDRMKAVRILERIKTLANPVAVLGEDRRI